MQPDVNEILTAGQAITFEDRDGGVIPLDLVTARNFRETEFDHVLFVGQRRWEREQSKNTTATTYDGYWVYPVYIYVPANAGEHNDYSDFSEAENAAEALIRELVGKVAEWELGDQDVFEGRMATREMVAAEVEFKKFATRRFRV